MKLSQIILLCMLISAVACTGCKKSSSNVETPQNAVWFTFQGSKYSVANPLVTIQDSYLSISGVEGGKGVDIYCSSYNTGTYGIGISGQSQAAVTFAISPAVNSTYLAESGSVTITTRNSTHVAGTFQCIAFLAGKHDGGVPVTGSFDVNIPQ